MTWLANNWETIMTVVNTFGLLFVQRAKVSKKDL